MLMSDQHNLIAFNTVAWPETESNDLIHLFVSQYFHPIPTINERTKSLAWIYTGTTEKKLALFTFNLQELKGTVRQRFLSLSLSNRHTNAHTYRAVFVRFNFIFILFDQLVLSLYRFFFFSLVHIYLFCISNTTSAVYVFQLRSLILMYNVHLLASMCLPMQSLVNRIRVCISLCLVFSY